MPRIALAGFTNPLHCPFRAMCSYCGGHAALHTGTYSSFPFIQLDGAAKDDCGRKSRPPRTASDERAARRSVEFEVSYTASLPGPVAYAQLPGRRAHARTGDEWYRHSHSTIRRPPGRRSALRPTDSSNFPSPVGSGRIKVSTYQEATAG